MPPIEVLGSPADLLDMGQERKIEARRARVVGLREAVREGRYRVDGPVLAEALLRALERAVAAERVGEASRARSCSSVRCEVVAKAVSRLVVPSKAHCCGAKRLASISWRLRMRRKFERSIPAIWALLVMLPLDRRSVASR